MSLFGDLNSTMARTISENSPKKYRQIIEPFGDGGTYSLYTKKKKPKTHIVNIVDEKLFNAFLFIKNISGSEKSQLKKSDWIGSKETFDSVQQINATSGAMFFYQFYYTKHFAARQKDENDPLIFDVSKIGVDVSSKLLGIPEMRTALKIVQFTNETPSNLIKSGGDTFLILLPSLPEDKDSTRNKLKSISGNFYYSAKVKEFTDTVLDSNEFINMQVSSITVATIMMGNYSVIKNYETKLLLPIDNELIQLNT